jgi:hypothetical protein
MTTLPVAGYFTDAARTNAEAKTGQDDMLEVQRESAGGAAMSELTIATGAVTPTVGQHSIDTEADAASDTLDTIAQTNLPDGSLLMIRNDTAGRDVILNHGAGGAGQMLLKNNVDYTLDNTEKHMLLRREGTAWVEVFRSHEAVFESALITFPISASTENSQAHGLGVEPTAFHWFIECATAEAGYAVGDRLIYDLEGDPSGTHAIFYDATDVKLKVSNIGALAAPSNLPHKTTFANTAITDANWKLGYQCWRG